MYKYHRFPSLIVKQAVYFKLRFTLSYRDVEELLSMRGLKVDIQQFSAGFLNFQRILKAI